MGGINLAVEKDFLSWLPLKIHIGKNTSKEFFVFKLFLLNAKNTVEQIVVLVRHLESSLVNYIYIIYVEINKSKMDLGGVNNRFDTIKK